MQLKQKVIYVPLYIDGIKTIYAFNNQNQHVKAYGYFGSNYFTHSEAEIIIFKIKIKYLKAVETIKQKEWDYCMAKIVGTQLLSQSILEPKR